MTNNNPTRPPVGNYWPRGPLETRIAGASPNRSIETPGPEPLVAGNIVTVKNFYPIPMDDFPGDKMHGFSFTGHQLVEGKLLLDFHYEAWVYTFDQNGNWKSSATKTYFGVALFDPVSCRWQVTVLPETLSSHNITLWRGGLYSSNNGKVQKFDWKENSWHTDALPIAGNYHLYNLNGKLYVADYNSIQQVTEDGRGTKLLASIQRRPAVTSLDSLGALMNLALFTDTQNILCAAVHNKVFRWDGADWGEMGEAPASSPPSVFEDGVLFMTDGWNIPGQISCFDTRSNIIETFLFPASQRQGLNLPDGLPKPLWKLPKELSLPNLSAAYWQSELFLMADHSEKQDTVAEEHGSLPDGTFETNQIIIGEKFLPKDGYDSALYCFSRGRAAAGKVLLKFDDSGGCPPMAGLGSNSHPLIPQIGTTKCWMLFTPKFLLCGRERLGDIPGSSEPAGFKPGVWVVPLDSVMTQFTSLKQTRSDQNVSK